MTTDRQMTLKLIENKFHVNRETTHREDYREEDKREVCSADSHG